MLCCCHRPDRCTVFGDGMLEEYGKCREAGQSKAEMLVKSRHYGGKETGLGTGHETILVTLWQTDCIMPMPKAVCGWRWKVTDRFVWYKVHGPLQQDCSQWDSVSKRWSRKTGKNAAQPGGENKTKQNNCSAGSSGATSCFSCSQHSLQRTPESQHPLTGKLTTTCKQSSRGSSVLFWFTKPHKYSMHDRHILK